MAANKMSCFDNGCICAVCKTNCIADINHPKCKAMLKGTCEEMKNIIGCPQRHLMTTTEIKELRKRLQTEK